MMKALTRHSSSLAAVATAYASSLPTGAPVAGSLSGSRGQACIGTSHSCAAEVGKDVLCGVAVQILKLRSGATQPPAALWDCKACRSCKSCPQEQRPKTSGNCAGSCGSGNGRVASLEPDISTLLIRTIIFFGIPVVAVVKVLMVECPMHSYDDPHELHGVRAKNSILKMLEITKTH